MKQSNQIKQIEQVETIPQLSEKFLSTEFAKLLPAYYVLREIYKDEPYVKLLFAKNHIEHYLGISSKRAYAYLKTECPFWKILPRTKNVKHKSLVITPFPQICANLEIFPIITILLTDVKYFKNSVMFRKARIFEDAVCKNGSTKIVDEFGRFGRCWKKTAFGRMIPQSNSRGETIMQREFNSPVSRSTIEERTNVPRTTQIRYGKSLRKIHTGFQTFFNFAVVEELTRQEFQAIQNCSCDLQLIEKIMTATGSEFLGGKFKARRYGNCHYIIEQLPNSFQNFVERVSPNKIRKLNQKVKKLVSKGKVLCKRLNNFFFGPRYTDDGYYYDGAKTLRPNIKEAFWCKIENGKRRVIFMIENLKDYIFRDLKQYSSDYSIE